MHSKSRATNHSANLEFIEDLFASEFALFCCFPNSSVGRKCKIHLQFKHKDEQKAYKAMKCNTDLRLIEDLFTSNFVLSCGSLNS